MRDRMVGTTAAAAGGATPPADAAERVAALPERTLDQRVEVRRRDRGERSGLCELGESVTSWSENDATGSSVRESDSTAAPLDEDRPGSARSPAARASSSTNWFRLRQSGRYDGAPFDSPEPQKTTSRPCWAASARVPARVAQAGWRAADSRNRTIRNRLHSTGRAHDSTVDAPVPAPQPS